MDMRRKHVHHCKHELPVHEKKPGLLRQKGMSIVLFSVLAVALITYAILISTETKTAGSAINQAQSLSLFPLPFSAQGMPNAQIILPDNPREEERIAANNILQVLNTARPCTPDNCPDSANPNQQDTDNDSSGDACDNCKNKPNTNQQDSDNDHIGDVCDNCAQTPNPDQKDTNNNGIGDACEPAVCPATFLRLANNTCVQCTNNSQCKQGETCQNSQCGSFCDNTGTKTVFQQSFTTLANFTPISGVWSIINNAVTTTDGTLVKALKAPFAGNMNSVSTTFTDQNNQAFIIFITNQNAVIAAGIRTTDQKQVVLEQWIPGQTTLPITISAIGTVPFITPGTHTLKVKFSSTTIQVLIDCQAFLNVSTTALSSITGTGLGIASGKGSFQDFTIQNSCTPGGFIPTGASILCITGAQVVSPDPDNDGIPTSCAQGQTILSASQVKNIFQKNNIILGTQHNNAFIKEFSGAKVLKGYAQLELQQQLGNTLLLINGGSSNDILSASKVLQNTAGFGLQGLNTCVQTTPTGPIILGTTCPTCTDQCQQNQLCTNQNQLALCKDTDGDGCIEQVFEQCTFGCTTGQCSPPPVQPPHCIESWVCGQYTNCQQGLQTRSCIDQNACGTQTTKPITQQQCSCTEDWNCKPFTDCSAGTQTRYCVDNAQCGTETTKPATSQSCASCADSTQNQGEQGIDCGGPCQTACAHLEQPTTTSTTALPILWLSLFSIVLAIVLITAAVLISHHMSAINRARKELTELPPEYMQKLVDYIRKDLSLGFTRNAIEQALLNEGWSRHNIAEAYSRIDQEQHLTHAKNLTNSFSQNNRNRPGNTL